VSELPKTYPGLERRCGSSRRRNDFPPLFSSYRRRRSNGRRRDDRSGYVDLYDLRSWGVALSVLILSLTDAVLTGMQIHGGKVQEANPIMNAAIRLGGIYSFVSLKAALTALPLAIIMLHKEWVLARYAARLCLWAYIMVALYHLYLIVEGNSLAHFATRIQ
jgi:hypothetical protein